jgi:glycosyltransferase involved in cell wall biosynthesis
MTTIAFYAPMKPPTHPTPSGDREIARNLLHALRMSDQDWSVELVSALRSYDGKGCKNSQRALIESAKTEATKLIAQGRREGWKLWFTYHNYYKAPDLIGPIVSKALDIPYVLLEATRAKKRLTGPWAEFAQIAEDASDQADVIFYFTQQDRDALEKYRHNSQQIIHLLPFLNQSTLTSDARQKPKNNTILTVGMLRKGAKFESYALIAKTLDKVKTADWHLNIAGDGVAKPDIEALFKTLPDKVTFLGQLSKAELEQQYTSSSLFFWPGVDEAFGMAYLEAQAAGLPLVAQDLPGVTDVIAPNANLSPIGNTDHMASQIDQLLQNQTHWNNCHQDSMRYVKENHLINAATDRLVSTFSPLIGPSK